MTSNYHGCASLVLEEQTALIVPLREFLWTVAVDVWLYAVEKSVFHSVLLLSFILGIWGTGRYTIIGTTSFQFVLGHPAAVLTKVEKTFLPSLSTGHEKCVWAKNLTIFQKLFSRFPTEDDFSVWPNFSKHFLHAPLRMSGAFWRKI